VCAISSLKSSRSLSHLLMSSCPIVVETLGPLNEDVCLLLSDLGRRILSASGDLHKVSFLCQRTLVVVQRFNDVLLHNGFVKDDQPNGRLYYANHPRVK